MKSSNFVAHYLVDFIDCDPEVIKFVAPARAIMLRALRACGATVVDELFHQFEPCGVSGAVLIAESHAGFHSWPENNFAAVDIFTCGEMNAEVAVEIMREGFRAGEVKVEIAQRDFRAGGVSFRSKAS